MPDWDATHDEFPSAPSMLILAYDLATETGVAVGNPTGSPTCFTVKFDKTPRNHGPRFADCLIMVKKHILEFKPDYIAIEQAIAAGPKGKADRVRVAMGLRGAVLAMAAIHSLPPPLEFSVETIRSHFLGNPNIRSAEAKLATMARCRMLGWKVSNDHEGDAAACWERARAHLKMTRLAPPDSLFGQGQIA